jgi:flagellin-like protein
VFGFLLEGIAAVIALAITIAIAFLLAAPAGVLIGRVFKPKQ